MSRTLYSAFTKTRSRYSSTFISRLTNCGKIACIWAESSFQTLRFRWKTIFYFVKNYLRRAKGPLARATAVGFPYNNILQSYQLCSSVLRDLATE